MLRNKKGFTLIELIVVIIIIGILAAVAAPMMASNTDRAKRSEAVAALGAVRTAQRLYYVENGNYANSIATLSSYIGPTDLNGRYYNNSNYAVNSTGAATDALYGSAVGITWSNGVITGG